MFSPRQRCPYCARVCFADFVDVGVGDCGVQCGPYHCDNCGASEIGVYDNPRSLTEQEIEVGWYGPDTEPGSSANVIGGKIVTAEEMLTVYNEQWTANPLYEVDGAVERWRVDIRND